MSLPANNFTRRQMMGGLAAAVPGLFFSPAAHATLSPNRQAEIRNALLAEGREAYFLDLMLRFGFSDPATALSMENATFSHPLQNAPGNLRASGREMNSRGISNGAPVLLNISTYPPDDGADRRDSLRIAWASLPDALVSAVSLPGAPGQTFPGLYNELFVKRAVSGGGAIVLIVTPARGLPDRDLAPLNQVIAISTIGENGISSRPSFRTNSALIEAYRPHVLSMVPHMGMDRIMKQASGAVDGMPQGSFAPVGAAPSARGGRIGAPLRLTPAP